MIQRPICAVQTKMNSRNQQYRFVDRGLITALVYEKRTNNRKVFQSLMSGLEVQPLVV